MKTKRKLGSRGIKDTTCSRSGYCNQSSIQTINSVNYGTAIQNNGFCFIEANFFLSKGYSYENLCELLASFSTKLGPDPDADFRFRTHSSFTLIENNLTLDAHREYGQARSYEDNQDGLGGVSRKFESIDKSIIENPLFKSILEKDIQIAKFSGLVNSNEPICIGVHQVRYLISNNGLVSYSSPPLHHRDVEPCVLVHFMGSTANIVGGTNTIIEQRKLSDGKTILTPTFVVDMKAPLETLGLSRKDFHAVQALTISSGVFGYRDILIVTFSNKSQNQN